jgi:6-phosphofructo-2-kinase/fructose-2,6-biphosphatase 1
MTGVVFVESLCDDLELLEENFRYKVRNSPDFKGMSEEEAIADLQKRVARYEERYETITDESLSYIKIFNLSTKLMVNHIYGRMAKVIVPALMAWNIGSRPIFLCRPGQTPHGILMDGEDYVADIDQDDPEMLDMSMHTRRRSVKGHRLGPAGLEFQEKLYKFVEKESLEWVERRTQKDVTTGTSLSGLAKRSEDGFHFPISVYTSTMPRAVQTVDWAVQAGRAEQLSNLNPLDKGDFNGMELEEIEQIDPAWYSRLEQDPFNTR